MGTTCSNTGFSQPQQNARRHSRLGAILTSSGVLSVADLDIALNRQRNTEARPQRRLGETLLDMGTISATQLRAALAEKLAIDRVDVDHTEVEPQALQRLPAALAESRCALPLRVREGRLEVALADPFDEALLAELAFSSGLPITPLLADPQALARGLRRHALATQAQRADRALHELQQTAPGVNTDNAQVGADIRSDAQPVVRLLDALLAQAVQSGASDINLRPGDAEGQIFFRIDGKQRLQRTLPAALLAPLRNRLKVIAKLDIATHRAAQDGQATVIVGGRPVDLRLSVLPTAAGESVSVRVLDKTTGLRSLDKIGFSEHDLLLLRRLAQRDSGMLLVTGPTGAGKSTTLYALLNEIQRAQPHIVTLEEPVEYRMPGVEQVNIRQAGGLSFAAALRAVLRHDPDVIMVGEIRDRETAQIATRAALTGHLVLSSLHTNNAAGAATRLLDLGVESHLLGSTLLGVVAQRLLALNCRHCAKDLNLNTEQRTTFGLAAHDAARGGVGCARCDNSGRHGRTVAYELLPVDAELRGLIHARRDAYALRDAAVAAGMRPLATHARELVTSGSIAPGELLAVGASDSQ